MFPLMLYLRIHTEEESFKTLEEKTNSFDLQNTKMSLDSPVRQMHPRSKRLGAQRTLLQKDRTLNPCLLGSLPTSSAIFHEYLLYQLS
ncbi:Meiosis Inhibitor Protein 1 [Manis pentadactyla]|nr:Meiosis Inhibitor Protein 1 [Manis pentadactyla]